MFIPIVTGMATEMEFGMAIRQSHNYFLHGQGAMILSERTVRLVKFKIA